MYFVYMYWLIVGVILVGFGLYIITGKIVIASQRPILIFNIMNMVTFTGYSILLAGKERSVYFILGVAYLIVIPIFIYSYRRDRGVYEIINSNKEDFTKMLSSELKDSGMLLISDNGYIEIEGYEDKYIDIKESTLGSLRLDISQFYREPIKARIIEIAKKSTKRKGKKHFSPHSLVYIATGIFAIAFSIKFMNILV